MGGAETTPVLIIGATLKGPITGATDVDMDTGADMGTETAGAAVTTGNGRAADPTDHTGAVVVPGSADTDVEAGTDIDVAAVVTADVTADPCACALDVLVGAGSAPKKVFTSSFCCKLNVCNNMVMLASKVGGGVGAV
jgi:hypothetical protein